MPKVLRMPPESELRRGAHREFVEELFSYYRGAGRPTLRKVSDWIAEADLEGMASPETVRRVLTGKVQPTWPTTEAVLLALCAMADRDVNAERWPYNNDEETVKDHVRRRWNDMIDEDPASVPSTLRDPWATAGTGAPEEPPF